MFALCYTTSKANSKLSWKPQRRDLRRTSLSGLLSRTSFATWHAAASLRQGYVDCDFLAHGVVQLVGWETPLARHLDEARPGGQMKGRKILGS